GYQIGLTYQAMPKNSGLGCEVGVLLSQKGSTFSDTTLIANIKQGYKELNYVEVPFNLRYRLTLGFVGIYGTAGIYGGYALSGKTVDEVSNNIQGETFSSVMDHVDYGYNFGAGVELFRKIQLGATWSQGLKNTANTNIGLPTPTNATNRVFSINLVYLF
ncbi:MAG TPA: outer membrane beta-barrel protein, partial [Paludibacter sp.]|nr:outer membrane beta-barrel protein [Paludibacter sp.]